VKGISRRAFAKRDGCSETLVRRALRNGHLFALDDGSLDPAFAGTGWREGNLDGSSSAHRARSLLRAEVDRMVPVRLVRLSEVLDDLAKIIDGLVADREDGRVRFDGKSLTVASARALAETYRTRARLERARFDPSPNDQRAPR
jgi:hypothetical protein